MRFLLLLLVVFSFIFYLFGSEEKGRVRTLASIAQAPGFAPGTVDGVTKVKGKRGDTFLVHFRYEVDGVSYRASTSSTDESGAQRYVSAPVTEIAYDRRNPSIGTLRQYYERRDRGETEGRAMFVSGILSLGLALPITFGVAWPLGWLRRKRGDAS